MSSTLPIALDAMGGDHAPGAIVDGAVQARDEHGIEVILVGRPDEIGDTRGIPVHEASEVIAMDDDAASSVRRKKDSSLVRAAELVRDDVAAAMVSAGNTGATAASALLRMGRIRGVNRPAIAAPIPVPGSTPTTLVDAGAMAEVQSAWLLQFAQMGSAYATERFDIATPRVGLLSIGEEPTKGTALVKETHGLLAASGLNFIGNVEGRDVMSDAVDVVVTDGFTGNVVLKTLEGALQAFVAAIVDALGGLDDGGAAAIGALAPLAAQMHPDTYGGALLLGTDGVCVISHGSSTPEAIVNALRVARSLSDAGLVDRLADAVAD
ncbi:MAG: phosphate acyltransferase PlsX [Actinomycetota bacterium]